MLPYQRYSKKGLVGNDTADCVQNFVHHAEDAAATDVGVDLDANSAAAPMGLRLCWPAPRDKGVAAERVAIVPFMVENADSASAVMTETVSPDPMFTSDHTADTYSPSSPGPNDAFANAAVFDTVPPMRLDDKPAHVNRGVSEEGQELFFPAHCQRPLLPANGSVVVVVVLLLLLLPLMAAKSCCCCTGCPLLVHT